LFRAPLASSMDGHATPEGTRSRAQPDTLGEGFYREVDGLTLSTIGMGSYLGDTDEQAREAYQESARRALEHGLTLVDTAVNYRHQASERDLGAAIAEVGDREGVVVVTKGGFVHGDVDTGQDPHAYLQERYLDEGIVSDDDVVRGMHCLHPDFLRNELATSRDNLGLETVDLYLVHNPETQLEQGVDEDEVYQRLEEAFAMLEEQREAGTIGAYGIATWEGLRVTPDEEAHLSLERVLEAAEAAHERADTSADAHGFEGVQLPFNMHLVEAAGVPTQPIGGDLVPALEAIEQQDLIGLTSASLMQGGLLGRVTEQARELLEVDEDLPAALHFARSAPGVATALVGMGTPEHVNANVDAMAGLQPDRATVEQLLGGIEQRGRR
jgi:aryl-alcohol dehydrogenase-like predicted oxidoreductase